MEAKRNVSNRLRRDDLVDDAVGRVDDDGEAYDFCSDRCLQRFTANPERFLHDGAPTRSTRLMQARRWMLRVSPQLTWESGCYEIR
jgi:hypothetical protein